MLKLEIIDENKQHFCVTSDEPVRIEVSVVNGNVLCYGYRGAETDTEQEPDVLYVQFPDGPDYMLGDNPLPYDPERNTHVADYKR